MPKPPGRKSLPEPKPKQNDQTEVQYKTTDLSPHCYNSLFYLEYIYISYDWLSPSISLSQYLNTLRNRLKSNSIITTIIIIIIRIIPTTLISQWTRRKYAKPNSFGKIWRMKEKYPSSNHPLLPLLPLKSNQSPVLILSNNNNNNNNNNQKDITKMNHFWEGEAKNQRRNRVAVLLFSILVENQSTNQPNQNTNQTIPWLICYCKTVEE